jgi:hypothetical protein
MGQIVMLGQGMLENVTFRMGRRGILPGKLTLVGWRQRLLTGNPHRIRIQDGWVRGV